MASFGDRLKHEREQRGITLDQIALSTKIGTRLLRALEEEHFEQLPGGIFNKGFVRAYARYVGMDEEQAVADYVAALSEKQAEKKAEPAPEFYMPVPREEAERPGAASVPWGTLAVLLLVVALAFAGWSYWSRESRTEAPRPTAAGKFEAATAPSAPRETPAAPGNPTASQPPPAQPAPAPAPQAQETTSESTPVVANNAPASISAPPALAPSALPPEASSAAAASLPSESTPSPGTFVVRIKAREDCWLSVTADGKVFVQEMIAPAERSVQARNQVVVKAGNVGALDLFFNGKKLPAQGGYGEVKTLTFNPDGLQPAPPTPQPSPSSEPQPPS